MYDFSEVMLSSLYSSTFTDFCSNKYLFPFKTSEGRPKSKIPFFKLIAIILKPLFIKSCRLSVRYISLELSVLLSKYPFIISKRALVVELEKAYIPAIAKFDIKSLGFSINFTLAEFVGGGYEDIISKILNHIYFYLVILIFWLIFTLIGIIINVKKGIDNFYIRINRVLGEIEWLQ